MILDTSVLIAIVAEEPGWQLFAQAMRCADKPLFISSATYVEARIVVERREHAPEALSRLELLLSSFEVEQYPCDEAQARLAAAAHATYGKGRHPAALNFGDCFSYALAKYLDQPLLYKGDDFAQTDLPSAVPA